MSAVHVVQHCFWDFQYLSRTKRNVILLATDIDESSSRDLKVVEVIFIDERAPLTYKYNQG
jgi:hypothetical protein